MVVNHLLSGMILQIGHQQKFNHHEFLALRETNVAPETGWLEVSFWNTLFSGPMLVLGRVAKKNLSVG